jgi:hypothetical protein
MVKVDQMYIKCISNVCKYTNDLLLICCNYTIELLWQEGRVKAGNVQFEIAVSGTKSGRSNLSWQKRDFS